MKGLSITASRSNSGKTLISLGLVKALMNRGYKVSAFKTGPDYIDTKLLSYVSGNDAGNLDIYMMSRENLKYSLSFAEGDFAIIEGAMGYFDGISNSFDNSTYDISREIGCDSILIYNPQGQMFSAIPIIKGMEEFSNFRIKGIILNKTSNHIYKMLKEQIETHCKVKVLGYIEDLDYLELPNKPLGLDHKSLDLDKIDEFAKYIEENIDLDSLILMAKTLKRKNLNLKKRNIKVGVALDSCFNFYYRENIEILNRVTDLVYFSPLNDEVLPDVDLIYIGGGYIEDYKEKLSNNIQMRENLKKYIDEGKYLYAERGGSLYLFEKFEGLEMVGALEGEASRVERSGRFGYIKANFKCKTIFGEKNDYLKSNEYHKYKIDSDLNNIIKAEKLSSKRGWEDGYAYKNTLVSLSGFNFLGNLNRLNYLLDKISK